MASLKSEMQYEDLQRVKGLLILEFGTTWCGHCQAAQPLIHAAIKDYPQVKHIKIEDGKGKHLGRKFAVRLWPTLVFIKDGIEVDKLVRPDTIEVIKSSLLNLTNIETN